MFRGPSLSGHLRFVAFSANLVEMIPITTVLIAEHKMFCCLFDHIQEELPGVENLAGIKHLARMVEGLLRNHAKAEEEVFLQVHDVLPHGAAARGLCTRNTRKLMPDLNWCRCRRICLKPELDSRRVLAASRKHFKHEERLFFPLIEKCIDAARLETLGMVWLLPHHSPAHWTI